MRSSSGIEVILERLRQNFYERIFDARAFDLYIRAQGGFVVQEINSFPLEKKLCDYIRSDEVKSILVLGDPGLGKTLLSYHLADLFWKYLGQAMTHSSGQNFVLPVWVYLPALKEQNGLKNILTTVWGNLSNEEISELKIYCQKNRLTILVIIDGLDEIRIPEKNFYIDNGWFGEEWPNIKVVTFSRPEAFSTLDVPSSYQRLFYEKNTESPTDSASFKELYVQSFSDDDVNLYLQYFVSINQKKRLEKTESSQMGLLTDNWDWKFYRKKLNSITPLAVLAKNPFVLSIMVQALPNIVEAANHDKDYLYTRERVYLAFVEDWLETQARRIWNKSDSREILLKAGLQDERRLKKCLWTYSENLACYAFNKGGGKLDTLLNQEITLIPELVHCLKSEKPYFHEDCVPEEILEIIRSGCLLTCQGDTYRFLHKTIVEFFAARAIFNGLHHAAEDYIRNRKELTELQENVVFDRHSLLREPQIVFLLADMVNTDNEFKKMLDGIIEFSKQESGISTAAANAFTILNVAGEIFNDRDYRGIHVSGADMTGAICDGTDFSYADLSSVVTKNMWIHRAKLLHTNLLDTKFGVLPSIKNDKNFSSMAAYPEKSQLFTGDMSGQIICWDLITCEKLYSWQASAYRSDFKMGGLLGFLPVNTLTISPNRKKLAYSTPDGGIHVCNLDGSETITIAISGAKSRGIFDGKELVNNIIFLENEKTILYYAWRDQGYTTWDIVNGKIVGNIIDKNIITIDGDGDVVVSKNGKYLACRISQTSESFEFLRPSDKVCNLFNVYNIENLQTVFSRKIEIIIKGSICAFSPKSTWLIFLESDANKNKALLLYSTSNWTLKRKFEPKKDGSIISGTIVFTEDEEHFLCEGENSLSIWHVESGNCLYTVPCATSTGRAMNLQSKTFPILLEWPSSTRAFCLRDNVIFTFDIDTLPRSFDRKCKEFIVNKLPQGTLFHHEEYYKHGEEYDVPRESNISNIVVSCKNIYAKDVELKVKVGTQEAVQLSFSLDRSIHQQSWSLISPDNRFLAFSLFFDNFFETAIDFPVTADIILWLKDGGSKDTKIRILDLQEKRLKYVLEGHQHQIITMIFSSDSQWLITGGGTVRIWDMASGKCIKRLKNFDKWVDAIALSQDKSIIAIFDGERNLRLWDVQQESLLGEVTQLIRRVKKLYFSDDGQYLECIPENGKKFFFRLVRTIDQLIILQLVSQEESTSFYCLKTLVDHCMVKSKNEVTLLKQLGAVGTPIVRDLVNNNNITASIFSDDESLYHSQAIVKMSYYSLIYNKLPLSYESWTISLLRDTKSHYPEHTFIIIEGVNTWGRLMLNRYEIATQARGDIIPDGCAKIVAKRFFTGLNWTTFCDTLIGLLNTDVTGRGLESIVGHTWAVPREKCLQLHKAIMNEKMQGLVPYSVLGKESFLSWNGHNCYTWCRSHLISLDLAHIELDLPHKLTDYIGAYPRVHLNISPDRRRSPDQSKCLVM